MTLLLTYFLEVWLLFHILHAKKNPDPCSEGLPQRYGTRSPVTGHSPPVRRCVRELSCCQPGMGRGRKLPAVLLNHTQLPFLEHPHVHGEPRRQAVPGPISGACRAPLEEGDASSPRCRIEGQPAAFGSALAGPHCSASPRLPASFPIVDPLLPGCRHLENQPCPEKVEPSFPKDRGKRNSAVVDTERGCGDTSGSCISIVNSSKKSDKLHSS